MYQKEFRYFLKSITLGIIVGISVAIVTMAMEALFGKEYQWDQAMLEEFLYGVTMGFTLTIINSSFFDYLNTKVRWSPNKDYYRIMAGFLGSVPLTLFGIWFVRLIIDVGYFGHTYLTFISRQNLRSYLGSLIITFFVSLVFHLVFLYRKLQDKKFKEQKIIAGNASAQFETLKSQIDPHFLFNSLNVLSSLIEEHPENAQRFTTSLSKIYRYVLEQKDKKLVPLEEELNFSKTYMKLLTMRYENCLTYSLPDLPIDEMAKVVPLSLQLLLENTIKHNVVSDKQPLHITISIKGDYLEVANNLQKKAVLQHGEGVGLKNIVQRYAILTLKKVEIEADEANFRVKIPILSDESASLFTHKNFNEAEAYLRAKGQVKDIKDFYGNLMAYCIVIPMLVFVNYQTYWGFKWFLFPMIGWGMGVALQAFSVFGYGKVWEERKIISYMEQQQHIHPRK